MKLVRPVHLAIAALLVIGIVVQVFLAGLGVFDGAADFETLAIAILLLGIVAARAASADGRLGARDGAASASDGAGA